MIRRLAISVLVIAALAPVLTGDAAPPVLIPQGVTVAGFPVKGVRVRLYDGSYHSVDSSEMAFKMAGSIAMKEALSQGGAVLL